MACLTRLARLFMLLVNLALCAHSVFAQSGGLINGARGTPVPNDGTTGTTLYGTAKLTSSGTAVNATTADTAVTVYIVSGGAGTTGNANLAWGGIVPCTMDSTIASGAGGYFVTNSTISDHECHAQSTQPAHQIGYLWDSSTSLGQTALVLVDTVSNGYNTIEVNALGPVQGGTINYIPAGLASVACSGVPVTNCTISAASGGSSPNGVQYFNQATYVVPTTDNQLVDDFTSTSAVTLPSPNTISTNPWIATRSLGAVGSCTPSCTTGSFTPTANDLLVVGVSWTDNAATVSSLTDSAGTTCLPLSGAQPSPATANGHTYAMAAFVCQPLVNSSQSLTFTFSANVNPDAWGASEYSVGPSDVELTGTVSSASAGTDLSIGPINTAYVNEIIVAVTYGSGNGFPIGYTQRVTSGFFGITDRFTNQLGSYNTIIPLTNPLSPQGALGAVRSWSITSVPGFTTGWEVVFENTSTTGTVTLTPNTPTTINGSTSLIIYPYEYCTVRSDGANYAARCGSIPNLPVSSTFSPLSGPWTPVFGATGTPLSTPHMVQGTGTLSGGTLAVTFTNTAVFTSSSSYQCWAVDTSTPANVVYSSAYTSGTSVTFTGTGTDNFRYTCVGD